MNCRILKKKGLDVKSNLLEINKLKVDLQVLGEIFDSELYQMPLNRSILKLGGEVNSFHEETLNCCGGSLPLVLKHLELTNS